VDRLTEARTEARQKMYSIRALYDNVRDAFIADPSEYHERCERKVYSRLVESAMLYHLIAFRQFTHFWDFGKTPASVSQVLRCCCPECAQDLPQCSRPGCSRQAIWGCPCHSGMHMCGNECAHELLQGGHMQSCVAYHTVTLCKLRDVDVYTVNPRMSCYELCMVCIPCTDRKEMCRRMIGLNELSMRDARRISESHVVAQLSVYSSMHMPMQYACSAGGCMHLAKIFCVCGSVAYCSDACRADYVSEHRDNCPNEYLHDDFSIVLHNGTYALRHIWKSGMSDGAKRLLGRDPLVGSRVSGYQLAMMDLCNLSPEYAAYFERPGNDIGLAQLHRCILQQKLMGHHESESRLFVRDHEAHINTDRNGGILTEQADERLSLFTHGYPHTSCMLAGYGLDGCRAAQVEPIWKLFAQFMLLPYSGSVNCTMQELAQCEARLVEVYELEYGGL
jgi:hypothetical protein